MEPTATLVATEPAKDVVLETRDQPASFKNGSANESFTLRLGGHDVLVIFDDDLHRVNHLGEIDMTGLCISVVPDLPKSQLARVLMHEILHGLLYTSGIVDHDEQAIDAVANGLVQVFRDNPVLADLFT